jgi:thiol-disulfide isomerase/thioredoxin
MTGVLLLAGVLALSGCAMATPTSAMPTPTGAMPTKGVSMEATPTATPEPDDRMTEKNFALMSVDGTPVTLNDTVGKKVYLKFWASWCSICLAGMSEFVEFNESKTLSEDIVVLTVVSPGKSGEKSVEDFKTWFAGRGWDIPVLLDDGGDVARDYGVRGYPTSVFIDSMGRIVKSQPGHMTNAEIDEILASMQ